MSSTDAAASGHECQCRVCRPDRFPAAALAPTRQGPAHFGARFGDAGRLLVYQDGQGVDWCTELWADSAGWAIFYARHPCACRGSELCEYVVYGSFSVEGVIYRDHRSA